MDDPKLNAIKKYTRKVSVICGEILKNEPRDAHEALSAVGKLKDVLKSIQATERRLINGIFDLIAYATEENIKERERRVKELLELTKKYREVADDAKFKG